MKRLTEREMELVGSGRCGGTWSSIAVESTFALAGGFVGYGLSFANPAGAILGAKIGFAVGGLVCHTS